jgi:hypothetical protein
MEFLIHGQLPYEHDYPLYQTRYWRERLIWAELLKGMTCLSRVIEGNDFSEQLFYIYVFIIDRNDLYK